MRRRRGAHEGRPAFGYAQSAAPRGDRGAQGLRLHPPRGDVSRPEVLEELARVAPLRAVRGNNDKDWPEPLPEMIEFELGGLRACMAHRKKDLPEDLSAYDLAICGHSHRYADALEGRTRVLNPGSCGPRRFSQRSRWRCCASRAARWRWRRSRSRTKSADARRERLCARAPRRMLRRGKSAPPRKGPRSDRARMAAKGAIFRALRAAPLAALTAGRARPLKRAAEASAASLRARPRERRMNGTD